MTWINQSNSQKQYTVYTDNEGNFTTEPLWTDVENPENYIPENFSLYAAFPNPAKDQTTFVFELPKPTDVKITVYNVLGQIVEKLHSESMHLQEGMHGIRYHPKGATGAYLYTIKAYKFAIFQWTQS